MVVRQAEEREPRGQRVEPEQCVVVEVVAEEETLELLPVELAGMVGSLEGAEVEGVLLPLERVVLVELELVEDARL